MILIKFKNKNVSVKIIILYQNILPKKICYELASVVVAGQCSLASKVSFGIYCTEITKLIS